MYYFSFVPSRFKTEFDMAGWTTTIGKKREGSIEVVHDAEVRSYCSEILSKGNHLSTAVFFPGPDSYIGTSCRYCVIHLKNVSNK